jgi:hypothetical protein
MPDDVAHPAVTTVMAVASAKSDAAVTVILCTLNLAFHHYGSAESRKVPADRTVAIRPCNDAATGT